MIYECKKTENCFADSQTYEYHLSITAEEFLTLLDQSWETRCNHKLRRPVFIAKGSGIKIKGILSGNVIRVSFFNTHWKTLKSQFEIFLKNGE